ncbi:PKD domain-containing protein [Haloquadratum walsbyi]|uniref:PKD domain-containing protein n=1 Tax=Haloquadratum walsbyi TaxID=293091 RepID=UPI0015F42756|nr:PKD domain-containing protein [Haloquadratum walsbyi]
MKINSVSPILVVVCAAFVVIPGAIVGTPGVVEDELFPEEAPEITVEPAPGAEQHITTTQTAGENTNVSIEIANPGVNADAITEFEELLVITHTDSTNAGSVTVTVEQQDSRLTVGQDLTFREPDSGVGATGRNLTLAPGESETLGIEINTLDVDVGDTLTTTITIKTQVPETDTGSDEAPDLDDDDDGDDSDEPAEQTPDSVPETEQQQQPEGTATAPQEQPQQTATAPEVEQPEIAVDIESAQEQQTQDTTIEQQGQAEGQEQSQSQSQQQQGQSIVDVDPISTESLPEGESRPTAVINSPAEEETEGSGTETETETTAASESDQSGETATSTADSDSSSGIESETSDLDIDSNAIVTTTDEEVELDGGQSTVGSTDAVSPSQQVSAAVDIDVPSSEGDTETTIELNTDRSTLGEVDPDEAVVGRLTDDGWQVLDTDVTVREDSVVLEAGTPGFSPFAIFADPDVRYTWTLPDGSTKTGRNIQTEFNEPGIYEAKLKLTNSLGQSDTTTQTIVVNDIPAIDNVTKTQTQTQTQTQVETDGNETTLTANISNEIGDVSVRWEFPDGTIKTGQTVTYPTQETQYTVQVRVEDEYGGEASTVETIVIPPEETLINQRVVPQQVLMPGILSLIGILGSVAGYRVVPWATIMTRIRRNPRIVELGTPFYEHDNRPIIAIRLSIVDDDGDELLTKEITPDGTGTTEIGSYRYELTPATLYVPPTLSINDTESYTIAVKTVNEKEKTATEHTREFTLDV